MEASHLIFGQFYTNFRQNFKTCFEDKLFSEAGFHLLGKSSQFSDDSQCLFWIFPNWITTFYLEGVLPLNVVFTRVFLAKQHCEEKERATVFEQCRFGRYYPSIVNVIGRIFPIYSSSVVRLGDSVIVGGNQTYFDLLSNWLNPVAQSNGQWTLCWRASLHGWAASTFHSLCNNKGPTVSLMRDTKNNVFGGYTSKSWSE